WGLLDLQATTSGMSDAQVGKSMRKSHAFSAGQIVATTITDGQGRFSFDYLDSGRYQLRAQVPHGRAWFGAGKILYAAQQTAEPAGGKLANIDFQLAPFSKGRWTKYALREGQPIGYTGRLSFGNDEMLWVNAATGILRSDGREAVNLRLTNGVIAKCLGPMSFYQDSKGIVWYAEHNSGIWRYDPHEGKSPAPLATPGLPADLIFEIAGTTDGAIWWRTAKTLVGFSDNHCTVFTNLWDPPDSLAPDLLVPKLAAVGERIWITGPGAGLVSIAGTNITRFSRDQGLLSM